MRRPWSSPRAESARSDPGPPLGEEKPREVFLAACADLAHRFEPRGFRYAKSGPRMTRRSGEYTFGVSFVSSHYNVAGAHVGLTVYANVLSSAVRKWRLEQEASSQDADNRVAGGMLQNLKRGTPAASWDLADPGSRPEVLTEIERAIAAAALPYFELFEDEAALVSRLEHEAIACFYPRDAIEWLISRGARDAAVRHARVLLGDEQRRREYERARSQMERGDIEIIPWSPVMEAEGLAYAALAYGLDY